MNRVQIIKKQQTNSSLELNSLGKESWIYIFTASTGNNGIDSFLETYLLPVACKFILQKKEARSYPDNMINDIQDMAFQVLKQYNSKAWRLLQESIKGIGVVFMAPDTTLVGFTTGCLELYDADKLIAGRIDCRNLRVSEEKNIHIIERDVDELATLSVSVIHPEIGNHHIYFTPLLDSLNLIPANLAEAAIKNPEKYPGYELLSKKLSEAHTLCLSNFEEEKKKESKDETPAEDVEKSEENKQLEAPAKQPEAPVQPVEEKEEEISETSTEDREREDETSQPTVGSILQPSYPNPLPIPTRIEVEVNLPIPSPIPEGKNLPEFSLPPYKSTGHHKDEKEPQPIIWKKYLMPLFIGCVFVLLGAGSYLAIDKFMKAQSVIVSDNGVPEESRTDQPENVPEPPTPALSEEDILYIKIMTTLNNKYSDEWDEIRSLFSPNAYYIVESNGEYFGGPTEYNHSMSFVLNPERADCIFKKGYTIKKIYKEDGKIHQLIVEKKE